MGSHRIAEVPVECDGVEQLTKAHLWTSGGISGLSIEHLGWTYWIPENILWDLFASEFKRRQIGKLEQMDAEDVRALVGVSDAKGK